MRKIKKISLLLGLLIPINVFAGASLSAPSSVEVGSNVTAKLTLTNTAAWNVSINSSGATSGCSQKFADATSNGGNATKVLTVTCKATSTGVIGFTATGDITSADGKSSNVSASKSVTVTEVRPKSNDNNLKSLTVEGYNLSPEFNKDTLEYSTTVPSNAQKIEIKATKNDSKASIEGVGTFDVTEGANPFNVVVTAENGTQKTYVVNVNVEDINPIKVIINNKEYTLVKNAKNLEAPDLYQPTTVKIGEDEIPAFYNEKANITLVGIKDSDGNISYAIYDKDSNSYKEYHEYISNLILYITKFEGSIPGYKKGTLIIDTQEVEVYRYKDNSRFVVVYAMNLENGEYDYYSYDTVNKTFQVFNKEEIDALSKEKNIYFYVMCAFGGALLLSIIIIITILKKKSKKKIKKSNIEILNDKDIKKKGRK